MSDENPNTGQQAQPAQTTQPAAGTQDQTQAPAQAGVQDQGGKTDTQAAAGTEDKTLLGGAGEEGQAPKKEEGKDTEAGKKAGETTVPEKYDIKVPDGMTLDQGMLDTFTPVFRELKLTQEQAQKLADAYAPMIKAQAEAATQARLADFQKIVGEWKDETIKALGADSAKKMALAAKAINKLGGPELREVLNETGVGNKIELVNFFIKVGEIVSEDTFTDTNTQQPSEADKLKVMYPSMTK